MRKPLEVGNYNGGYLKYRYGRLRAQAHSAKSHEKIYKADQRKELINHVINILKDWRLSRFENEGPLVAGLRSELCLLGYGWGRSHAEAEAIVSTALTQLGCKRPTWDEGQREYTIAGENCAWCRMEIPDDLRVGALRCRYCSDECARFAIMHRDIKSEGETKRAYKSAREAILRTRNTARSCQRCGTTFRPMLADAVYCSNECNIPKKQCACCNKSFQPIRRRMVYCSHQCSSQSQMTVDDKTCQHCGVSFRPNDNTQVARFCSVMCTNESFKNQHIEAVCMCCGISFIAKNKLGMYCSERCKKTVLRFKSGNLPKHISPKVFDYVFKQAA